MRDEAREACERRDPRALGPRICRELYGGDNTLMETVGETTPSGEGSRFGQAPVASWSRAHAKRHKR